MNFLQRQQMLALLALDPIEVTSSEKNNATNELWRRVLAARAAAHSSLAPKRRQPVFSRTGLRRTDFAT
jgi:hypothetical protein